METYTSSEENRKRYVREVRKYRILYYSLFFAAGLPYILWGEEQYLFPLWVYPVMWMVPILSSYIFIRERSLDDLILEFGEDKLIFPRENNFPKYIPYKKIRHIRRSKFGLRIFTSLLFISSELIPNYLDDFEIIEQEIEKRVSPKVYSFIRNPNNPFVFAFTVLFVWNFLAYLFTTHTSSFPGMLMPAMLIGLYIFTYNDELF